MGKHKAQAPTFPRIRYMSCAVLGTETDFSDVSLGFLIRFLQPKAGHF